MRAGLAAGAALALAIPVLAQSEDERFAAGTEKVASEALSRFVKLVTAENYGQLGFESPDEDRSAKLGSPLRQLSVGLEDLRRFEPEAARRSRHAGFPDPRERTRAILDHSPA